MSRALASAKAPSEKAAPAKQAEAAPRPKISGKASARLQRKCDCGMCGACDKEKRLQREAKGATPESVPVSVGRTLARPGAPLPAPVRKDMEGRFGQDFGGVRLHTDADAARSAQDVNARAYTVGDRLVFGQNQFRPDTAEGSRLLAHELAHAVQQRGPGVETVNPAPDAVQRLKIDDGPTDPLERDADRMATAALSHSPFTVRPAVSTLARLSRVKDEATPLPRKEEWDNAKPPFALPARVRKYAAGKGPEGQTVGIFDVGAFPVPSEKGNAGMEAYKKRAESGRLEAVISAKGRAELKQYREVTDDLKKIWISKIGLDENQTITDWKANGGYSPDAPFVPKPDEAAKNEASKTCQVDHIIELQIGGENTAENMQMLDPKPNRDSGAAIRSLLAEIAGEIVGDPPQKGLPEQIILHFSTAAVKDAGGTGKCYEIGQAIENKQKGKPLAGGNEEEYNLKAASETKAIVSKDFSAKGTKKVKNKIPLLKSDKPRNQGVGTLVPGFLLMELDNDADHDVVKAEFDERKDSKATRIPFKTDKEFTFTVEKESRKLKLPAPHAGLKIYYPYLSAGVLTSLRQTEKGAEGAATITPSIPLLPKLDVEFAPGSLKVLNKLDKDKLKTPPGTRLTKADISLQLLPELSATGEVGFEVGPKGKPVATGNVKADADANGFKAVGKLIANVPGLKQAEGEVRYGKDAGGVYGWEAKAHITGGDLPRAKSINIDAGLDKDGLALSGEVVLDVPRTGEGGVKLTAERDKNGHIRFRGDTKIQIGVAGIEDVDLYLAYDLTKDKLTGKAETPFAYQGFKGHLSLTYDEGKIGGTGTLHFEKGKAKGDADVHFDEKKGITGKGSLTYAFSKDLIATAGVTLDEHHNISLAGALEYKKPIVLFPMKSGGGDLFALERNIPVPGLSVGPIGGVMFKVTAGVSGGYSFGPGAMKGFVITGSVKPFDPNPDPNIKATSRFDCPLSVTLSGYVSAGLAVSVAIAEASANLKVTVSGTLRGGVSAPVTLEYAPPRFHADLGFEAQLELLMRLALSAYVEAKVALGIYTKRWEWELASYLYKPAGLNIGVKAKKPLSYDSETGLSFPSFDEFDIRFPEIKPDHILESLLQNAAAQEKEK